MSDIEKNTVRLIPVTQWKKYHCYPSIAGLRYLIFNAESNGFNRVIRRIGRRVVINEEQFFLWVDSIQNRGNQYGK